MGFAAARIILLALLMWIAPGCSVLLPTSQAAARSKWHSLREAATAFERIVPGTTSAGELALLGFDPESNANVRILTYLDVIQRFMSNRSITKDDLYPAVRAFIEARDQGDAWEIEANHAKAKRYGNAFLDVTGFVKKTHEPGWQFKSLQLIRDGRVVYKLASGQPNLVRYGKRVRPLGPLQDLDSLLLRTAERSR